MDSPTESTQAAGETPGPSSRKRIRRTKTTQVSLSTALNEATDEAVYQWEEGIPSKHERDIKILEEYYADKLTLEEMVKVVCLFEDRSKACVFLGLSGGAVRDA